MTEQKSPQTPQEPRSRRIAICKSCGMGVNLNDPLFHEERYAHTAEWDEPRRWEEVLAPSYTSEPASERSQRLQRPRWLDRAAKDMTGSLKVDR